MQGASFFVLSLVWSDLFRTPELCNIFLTGESVMYHDKILPRLFRNIYRITPMDLLTEVTSGHSESRWSDYVTQSRTMQHFGRELICILQTSAISGSLIVNK